MKPVGAYYIQTDVLLKLGRNQGYNEMMARLVPVMASHGWKLVMALQPMIGDFRKLTHIWEIAKFDDIRGGLEACAADPAGQAILAPMPELLETEALTVMVRTPYAP